MKRSELPYKANPLLSTCLPQHQLQTTLFPEHIYTNNNGKITYNANILGENLCYANSSNTW